MQHATAVLDILHGLIGRSLVSTTVCEGIADVLETVARLAREAAEAGAAAAVAVGEAQRHAENLVEVLGAAGLWEKMDEESKSDKQRASRKNEAKDSDSSEDEKEPWEEHAEWVCIIQKLNGEVLALQQELRGLVITDPALIHAVSPPQKESLFAVVAELLAQARHAVSRSWYAQWVTHESAAPKAFNDLVEASLAFVTSASLWDKIAVPSIDSRILRLAALLDCRLLCTLLREDLFEHVLQLASKDEAPCLEARFAAVTSAMTVGFVSG